MKNLVVLVLALSLSATKCFYIDEDCLIFPVYPVQYEITLTPYMSGNQFYYEGEITIVAISTVAGQSTIELDAKNLHIYDETVGVFIDNKNIVDSRRPVFVDQRRGKVIIYLREGLRSYGELDANGKYESRRQKNQYYIKLRFRGNINKGDSGMFATSYQEDDTVKWVLSTRMSPKYASTVFPCFDNPRMEAGFIIRVYRPSNLHTSLSVSRESRQQNISSHTLVEFSPSPQIPSFKLGLHLSEFIPHHVPASQNQRNYLVIWTRRKESDTYFYSLTFGNKVLNALNGYMNWTRPITSGHINVVALPNYWRSYEKGSWNLLTVGNHKLLVDEEVTSALQKEQIAFELSRQLSRIWLGNPDETSKTKWKEEWFKEGMATYFGHYFMAWGDMYQRGHESLGSQIMYYAMRVDSRANTRPLTFFNLTSADILPDDVENLITMKTASLLRMIEHWLGSEAFHIIMRDYLTTRYGRTITIKDYGDFLQKQAINCEFFKGYTIGNVISSWIDQPGYPVVNVHVYRDRHVIALSQKRFLIDNEQTRQSNYLIPISYTTQYTDNCLNCIQPKFVISGSDYTFQENLNNGWIILNKKSSGYYRVNYDVDTWLLIIKTLKSSEKTRISALNRAEIMNDAFALYAAGHIDLSLAAQILSCLQDEEDLNVWDAAIQGYALLMDSPHISKQSYEFWMKFMRDHVLKIYTKLMMENRRDLHSRIFKSKIVNFACSVDLPACISDIGHLQLGHESQINDPDLREAYYCVKLKQQDAWKDVKRHLETCGAYEKEDILYAKKMTDEEKEFSQKLKYDPSAPQNIEMPQISQNPKNCCVESSHTGGTDTGGATSISAYFYGLLFTAATVYLIN